MCCFPQYQSQHLLLDALPYLFSHLVYIQILHLNRFICVISSGGRCGVIGISAIGGTTVNGTCGAAAIGTIDAMRGTTADGTCSTMGGAAEDDGWHDFFL
jgi:hypothetical protein